MPNSKLQISPTQKDQWKHFCDSGRLYAIVDACDEPAVPPKVKQAGARAVCLYRGGQEERYAHVAPYLFHLDAAGFDWISQELWPSPWGIFVYSDAPLQALHSHFRHFLTVKDPAGTQYLLRFYDPRVLPKFLQSFDDGELAQFFGPVRGFGAKNGDDVSLLRLREAA